LRVGHHVNIVKLSLRRHKYYLFSANYFYVWFRVQKRKPAPNRRTIKHRRLIEESRVSSPKAPRRLDHLCSNHVWSGVSASMLANSRRASPQETFGYWYANSELILKRKLILLSSHVVIQKTPGHFFTGKPLPAGPP